MNKKKAKEPTALEFIDVPISQGLAIHIPELIKHLKEKLYWVSKIECFDVKGLFLKVWSKDTIPTTAAQDIAAQANTFDTVTQVKMNSWKFANVQNL